jgi:uncharacterized protein
MANPATPWRAVPEGVALSVRVTPKSSRDAIEGIETRGDLSALKVRVRAVPEDGKANAAVAALIADWLDLPKRSATVTGGLTSRDKTVTLTGSSAALERALTAKFETQGSLP